MLFHNPTKHALSFQIGSLDYQVPPGSECDIPPNLSYVVASRGLPLKEGSAGGARVEASVALPPPSRPLPPGVETGPSRDEEPEVDEFDEAPAVTQAADRLREQGVLPPKGKRR